MIAPRLTVFTAVATLLLPAHTGLQKQSDVDAVNKVIVAMRENGEMARIFGKYGVTEPSVWTPPR